MVSVIIPARNERFLNKTIEDILSKAEGRVEIYVILEGYWPDPFISPKNVHYVHFTNPRGMRNAINTGAKLAKGEYLLKTDAHCMFDQGFDLKLIKYYEENTVVIPRRHRLEPEEWVLQEVHKPPVDYEYLSFPDNPNDWGGPGLNGKIWNTRTLERMDKPEFMVDDNLSFQGSCWFMSKKYFEWLEIMDDQMYGPFWNEAQEIGFKVWLSGGRVRVNKHTWYAHLHKGKKYGRGYYLSEDSIRQGAASAKRWIREKMWHKQTMDFDTMIERFMPMPDWPEDWKKQIHQL